MNIKLGQEKCGLCSVLSDDRIECTKNSLRKIEEEISKRSFGYEEDFSEI